MAFKLQTLINPTLVFFFTFMFFTSASKTTSLDHNSNHCTPKNCGFGPNLSYPFWIDGVHESSCGLPDFKIKCNEDHYPVLEISDEDFIIQNIFPQNHSFLVVSVDAYGHEHSCPLLENSLDDKPFRFSSDTEFVEFKKTPSCYRPSPIRVPVRKKPSEKMNYVDTLKRGFVLNWIAPDCSKGPRFNSCKHGIFGVLSVCCYGFVY